MRTLLTIWIVTLALCGQALALEPAELVEIRNSYDAALNAHDLDTMMTYWLDDGVLDFVPLPTLFEGKEAARAFLGGLIAGFPDLATTEGIVLAADNIVVVEHSTTGTHDGTWMGIPPTGNPGAGPHIDIYEFEGDKIKRSTAYMDTASLMIQLGVLPAPNMPELVPSFTLPDPEPTGLSPMEANAEMLARWNAHDMTGLAKMVRPDAQIMESAFGMADRDTFIASSELLFQGFSDIRGEFVRSIDMGDGWVAIEVVFTGTHDGMFNGIPATGRVGTLRAAGIRRFDAEGLMTNFSLYYDNMTIMTQLTANSFADHGSGTTTQLFAGGATWQLNWGQGPWTWSTITGESLLDSNVSAVLDMHTTAAADTSADLIATLPVAGTLTLTAHDEHFPEVTTGTMVLSGAGVNVIDINASRVMVDEGAGMFLAPFHPPGPKVVLALDQATGIFGHITQVGPWELVLAGSYAVPLIEGMELQDNIFTALGGNVALIGGIGEFALSGLYTPNQAKLPIDFCQYGTASTEKLAPDGGGWNQQWGLGPWDWLTCTAETNAQFLNENVTGTLTTQVTGLPDISEDLILHIPLAGQQIMTEHAAGNPDEVIGQITCDVIAMFVADMNAQRASVNEAEDTITIAFGASVEEGPDGLMTVAEANK
ncbi:MAG: ester cyclase [Planctomycetota bacterium]|jgi:predicted ester cyclase